MVGPINSNNDIKVPTLARSWIPGDPCKNRCFFRLRELSLDSYKNSKFPSKMKSFFLHEFRWSFDCHPAIQRAWVTSVRLLLCSSPSLKNFLSPSFKIFSTYPPTLRYSLHPFLSTYNYALDCKILKIHCGAWDYGPPLITIIHRMGFESCSCW